MQGIHSTLLIDILYFMLAWSCRAPGGEEKATSVDSAVQLGRLLFREYGLQDVPERIHVSVLSWNVFNTVSENFCESEIRSFSFPVKIC